MVQTSLRISEELKAVLDAAVLERRKVDRKFSLNDLMMQTLEKEWIDKPKSSTGITPVQIWGPLSHDVDGRRGVVTVAEQEQAISAIVDSGRMPEQTRRDLLVGPDNPQPATQEEIDEIVRTSYPPSVLEHAAKAEAPIGKSVTEFLLKTTPKIDTRSGAAIQALVGEGLTDDWERRCVLDFGKKILDQAARSLPGWKKMTWEQRHAKLKEQKEGQDGW